VFCTTTLLGALGTKYGLAGAVYGVMLCWFTIAGYAFVLVILVTCLTVVAC
jgi:hypothetical protein